jgi:hypothetical protein
MTVTWAELILPALVAAVGVFVASSVIHMVLKLHNPDYKKLPNEDEVRDAIRRGGAGPGQYILPHCNDPKEQADPAMVKKYEEGPNGVLYVGPKGVIKLGPFLGKWFLYTVLIGLAAGYVAKSTLFAGTGFTSVFRVTGAAAWLAYSWQSPSDSIWKAKPWIITFRGYFDGLVYALITGACFGWMWPS